MTAARYKTKHSTKDKHENYVVFQGGVERVSLPNNVGQGPTCYEQQAKLKQTKK